MRDETYTPGGRAVVNVPVPMRVLYRFTKPGGHVLELRERKVTTFRALEWLQFVDDSLIESRLYHGAREPLYAAELQQRVVELEADGWVAEAMAEGGPVT